MTTVITYGTFDLFHKGGPGKTRIRHAATSTKQKYREILSCFARARNRAEEIDRRGGESYNGTTRKER